MHFSITQQFVPVSFPVACSRNAMYLLFAACGSVKLRRLIFTTSQKEWLNLLCAFLCYWLSTAVAQTLENNGSLTCTIVTGYGKSVRGSGSALMSVRGRCFAEPGITSDPFSPKPRWYLFSLEEKGLAKADNNSTAACKAERKKCRVQESPGRRSNPFEDG